MSRARTNRHRKMPVGIAVLTTFGMLLMPVTGAEAVSDSDVTVVVNTNGDSDVPGSIYWAAEEYKTWANGLTEPATFTVQIDPSLKRILLDWRLEFQGTAEFSSFVLQGNGSKESVIAFEEDADMTVHDSANATFAGFSFVPDGHSSLEEFGPGEYQGSQTVFRDIVASNVELAAYASENFLIEGSEISNSRIILNGTHNDVAAGDVIFDVENSKLLNTAMRVRSAEGPIQINLDGVSATSGAEGPTVGTLIYQDAGYPELPISLSIRDSTFSNAEGSAIELSQVSSLSIEDSTFADLEESAVRVVADDGTLPAAENAPRNFTVSNSVFSGIQDGQALYISLDGETAEASLTGNLFSENGTSATPYGTVVQVDGPRGANQFSFESEQNLFNGNLAETGLSVDQGGTLGAGSVGETRVLDTQFVDNVFDYTAVTLEGYEADVDEKSSMIVEGLTVVAQERAGVDPKYGSALIVSSESDGGETPIVVRNSTFVGSNNDQALVTLGNSGSTAEFAHNTFVGGGMFVGLGSLAHVSDSVFETGDVSPVIGDEVSATRTFVSHGSTSMPEATRATVDGLDLGTPQDNGSDFRFADGSAPLTVLPGASSVLLKSGAGVPQLDTDQRGLPRPADKFTVGAVERYLGSLTLGDDQQVTEGEPAALTVDWQGYPGGGLLQGRVDGPLEVTAVTEDGSAVAGKDYEQLRTSVKASEPGATPLTVATRNRAGVQGTRSFVVSLESSASSPQLVDGQDRAEVTIIDRAEDGGPNTDPGKDPDKNDPNADGEPDLKPVPGTHAQTDAQTTLANTGSPPLGLQSQDSCWLCLAQCYS